MTKRAERERTRVEKGRRKREGRLALRVDLVHPFSATMVAMLVLQQLSKIDITLTQYGYVSAALRASTTKAGKGERQRAILRKSIRQRRNPLAECFPPGTACGCMCSANHIDHPSRFHVHCRLFSRVKDPVILRFSLSFDCVLFLLNSKFRDSEDKILEFELNRNKKTR